MDLEQLIGTRLDGMNARLDKLAAYQNARAAEMALLRGAKQIRLPLVTGKASGSALSIGGDTIAGIGASPMSGFIWSLRHLSIEGLVTGVTPDTVNIVTRGRIIWQLNGNQFAQTWGRGEIIMEQGETLSYVSVGAFTSTATIIAHGLADEYPAELRGRLI
jgi:hypothetical protein